MIVFPEYRSADRVMYFKLERGLYFVPLRVSVLSTIGEEADTLEDNTTVPQKETFLRTFPFTISA